MIIPFISQSIFPFFRSILINCIETTNSIMFFYHFDIMLVNMFNSVSECFIAQNRIVILIKSIINAISRSSYEVVICAVWVIAFSETFSYLSERI